MWSCLDNSHPLDAGTSKEITGWDIDGMLESQQNVAEVAWLREADSRVPVRIDDTQGRPDTEVEWISVTMVKVLQSHAKPLRICAWSKRWWNADIDQH
jgi:hypothetical protein